MKPNDKNDFVQQNAALELACDKLRETLLSAGVAADSIPVSPKLTNGDDVSHNTALIKHHGDLAVILANKVKAQPPSSPVATPSPVVTAAPAPVVSAELTKDEIAALTWTERVEYSGKKLSATQLRERIASREKNKKPKNYTALILEAKGVKELSQLPVYNDRLD